MTICFITGGLGGEQTRWEAAAETAGADLLRLPGDTLLAAASLAYLPPHLPEVRCDPFLLSDWLAKGLDNLPLPLVICHGTPLVILGVVCHGHSVFHNLLSQERNIKEPRPKFDPLSGHLHFWGAEGCKHFSHLCLPWLYLPCMKKHLTHIQLLFP